MQYLDALEGLRSQGFPQESITTKRYEILQHFMEGVRDPVLRRELAIVYASESFLAVHLRWNPCVSPRASFSANALRQLNNLNLTTLG